MKNLINKIVEGEQNKMICKRKPNELVKKVIFNGTHTVVLWSDGIKTIVNCNEGDEFDKEKGIALCFMKRFCGNTGAFNEILKKFAYDEELNEDSLIPITTDEVYKMGLIIGADQKLTIK